MSKNRFEPKFKIKKGDDVIVISGATASKDKDGKYIVRKVQEVLPKKGKVIIEGANMVKKHTKPDAKNPEGGIIPTEAPIDISNVSLVDPKTGEPTRVKLTRDENGKLHRIAKKSGEVI